MSNTTNTSATATAVDQTVYNPDAACAIGFENITDTTIVTTPETVDVVDSPMPVNPQTVHIDDKDVIPTEQMVLKHISSGSEFELYRIALTPDTVTEWNYRRIGLMPIKGLGQAIYLGIDLIHSGEKISTDLIACSLVKQNKCSCTKDAGGCDACPLNVLTLDDVRTGKFAPEPIEFILEKR